MDAGPFSDRLLQRLARARRIAVLTGAGVSAESGIATFRDVGGLWSRFKPEELANVDAFLRNPDLVQRWYAERRRVSLEALPNEGHLALVEMEHMCDEFTLITQNVDNLHHRAGSRNIVELHGNITRNYCIDCRRQAGDGEEEPGEGRPSACSDCGGFIRPDVVWFGEMLPADALESAYTAAVRSDVFLSIGTSAMVYPAADIPLAAGNHGAFVAEINVEPSAIAGMIDETVLGASGTVLPQLVASMRTMRG